MACYYPFIPKHSVLSAQQQTVNVAVNINRAKNVPAIFV
jgi:hypothetical protein